MDAQLSSAGYEVPTYQAPPGTVWYHFLHGNVPGHQIDFMYRPEVPQGSLTRQHFSHLARLVKYIEPRHGTAYAFAIGNLSRDDTQYEPGRGGVALIFGLRIKGAKDHAGRQDPPFCHSMAAIDRNLDERMIYEAATAFYRKLLPDEESQAEGSGWYHSYVQYAQKPDALLPLLRLYLNGFLDLPTPGPSGLGLRWSVEHSTPPKRVVVVYPDRAPFEALAQCAARIAGVLVESDIRWTAISSGREADVQGGISVRFVPQREAGPEPADVVVVGLDEVPEDARGIAEKLFHAQEVRNSKMPELRMGWRQMYAQQGSEAGASNGAAAGGERPPSVKPPAAEERPRPWAQAAELATGEIQVELGDAGAAGKAAAGKDGAEEKKAAAGAGAESRPAAKKAKSQVGVLVGVGVAIAVAGVVAAVAVGTGEKAAEGAGNVAPPPVPSAPLEVKAQPTAMAIDAPAMVSTAKVPATATTAPSQAGMADKAGAAGTEQPELKGTPKPTTTKTSKGGTTKTNGTKTGGGKKSAFDF